MRSETLTEPTALEAVRGPLVAVGGRQLWTVGEGVVAGVGGGRGEALTEPTAPPAVLSNVRSVAAGGRQVGTVHPLVLAGLLSGEGRVSGPGHGGAGEGAAGAA